MRKLYPKLAAVNMKNNRQLYLPYLLAGGISVAMFYLIMAMKENPGILVMNGGATVRETLSLGVVVVGLFACVLLFYTNSFIMKRRKKEIGVYNILGMEKKHIAKVLTLEMIFTALVTIVGGLAFGIAFNKLFTMLLYRLTGLKESIPFVISSVGCLRTLILFALIYGVTLCYNLMQMKLANPIELLHGSNTGEREPKTKILLTIVGALTLGGGYYIALTVGDSIAAITMFFVAVILVIIGTYCLFTAGSIAVLKLLRRKKKYYYQAKHFTTVSGMLYRMKQNAVGLANICILSTMVLVTVSTTVCMYLGVEDELYMRYPSEVEVLVRYSDMPEETESLDQVITDTLKESGRTVQSQYGYLDMMATSMRSEDGFTLNGINTGVDYDISDVTLIRILTKSDYESITGEAVVPLKEGEVAVAASPAYENVTMNLDGQTYEVKGNYEYSGEEGNYMASISGGAAYIIVPDEAEFERIFDRLKQNWNQQNKLTIRYEAGCDIDGSREEKLEADEKVKAAMEGWTGTTASQQANYVDSSVQCREEGRDEYYAMNGGFLFLGLFLGAMFLMVTILIMFYKQISEGFEDKERYAIMEKVGMSNEEVRRSIRSQVLTVFFLPIGVAVVHIIMAFPMIKLIMECMRLTNTALFVMCVAGTALVFFIIYFLVFVLTSRSYYKIVGNQV